jgi:inner membrane protein
MVGPLIVVPCVERWLLSSESNALLPGALPIFAMLSVLMLATRKIDCYAFSPPRIEPSADAAPSFSPIPSSAAAS